MPNHPNRKTSYPDVTFERLARHAGAQVRVMWEQPGPRNTEVAWNVFYDVNGYPVLVQTYAHGNGWNVFTAAATNDIEASIADALTRCHVPVPPKGNKAG